MAKIARRIEHDYSAGATASGSYELEGRCSNCGTQILGRFAKGQVANTKIFAGRHCPECGCDQVTFHPNT